MSYKLELSDLKRERRGLDHPAARRCGLRGDRAAVSSTPAEQLPPTRELAELAGVNHLTAVRAYRRLRELGLVTAHVGRGTFVREHRAARPTARVPDSIAWQRYALPEYEQSYGDEVLAEMHRQATAEGLIPLSVGYPSARLFPVDAIREATDVVLRERARPGAPVLRDPGRYPSFGTRSPRSRRRAAPPRTPRDIIITTGASQGLTPGGRAVAAPRRRRRLRGPELHVGDQGARARPRSACSVCRSTRMGSTSTRSRRCWRATRSACSRSSRGCTIRPGATSSPARREQLLALVRRHGFFVLEDGIYADLRFEGRAGRARCVPRRPRTSSTATRSRRSVGGGLRAGWVAASGPVLDRIVAEKRRDDIHSPTLTQLVVARYLASGAYPRTRRRARNHYRERSRR